MLQAPVRLIALSKNIHPLYPPPPPFIPLARLLAQVSSNSKKLCARAWELQLR
jgi:hypothetical protein